MTEDRRALPEESFLGALAEDLKESPLQPHVILVGSNLLGIHLRHSLTQRTGGHANVRFLTFVDLAEALTRDSFLLKGRQNFPADAESLLVSELCQELPQGSPFYDVRGQEGFHKALISTFHDLIDAGVTELPKGGKKLCELARLFSKHRTRYLPTFAATADRLLEAAAFADRFQTLFQTSKLYVYGFYDFTEVQRRLLEKLSETVSLQTYDIKPLSLHNPAKADTLSAPDPFSEAEEVVRWVLKLKEKEDLSLHRVGILLRDREEMIQPFALALDRAHVPYYREGGTPLAQTPLGNALLRAVDLFGTEWKRTDVVRLLTAFPFRKELLKEPEMGTPADWDLWSRRASIVSGKREFLTRLSRSHATFVTFLRSFFDQLESVEKKTSDFSSFGKGVALLVVEYAEPDDALPVVLNLCRSLSSLDRVGVKANQRQIQSIFKRRVSKTSLRKGTFNRDGLFLGSIASARGILFDYVAIPGLAERSFPLPPRPDPLLLDFERRRLNEGGAKLPLKEGRPTEERQLFELASAQAQKKLLLSYARAGIGGDRENQPSSFLLGRFDRDTIAATLVPRLRWERGTQDTWLDEQDWVNTEVASWVTSNREKAWKRLLSFSPLSPAVATWATERLSSPFFGSRDGILPPESDPEKGRRLSASNVSTYASCPYRYFLKEKIKLAPHVRPDEIKQLRPIDRGEIIHEILFRLYTSLRQQALLPLKLEQRDLIQQHLLETAKKVFSEVVEKLPLGPKLLWETERTFLLADLKALLDLEIRESSNFCPEAFEVRFGMRPTPREDKKLSTDRSVAIKVGEEEIFLHGKIDRIDLSPDRRRARIIDYKSGTLKRQKGEKLEKGKAMQLPIYLSALSVLFTEIDLSQSEALLLSTSYGSGFRRVRFSGSTFVAKQNDFHSILGTVSRGIRSGLYPPFPGKNLENCTFCDFQPICGRSVLRTYERKKDDPAISALRALEEIE